VLAPVQRSSANIMTVIEEEEAARKATAAQGASAKMVHERFGNNSARVSSASAEPSQDIARRSRGSMDASLNEPSLATGGFAGGSSGFA
jgi:hypothetical protein